jgi:hypothetical protein
MAYLPGQPAAAEQGDSVSVLFPVDGTTKGEGTSTGKPWAQLRPLDATTGKLRWSLDYVEPGGSGSSSAAPPVGRPRPRRR